MIILETIGLCLLTNMRQVNECTIMAYDRHVFHHSLHARLTNARNVRCIQMSAIADAYTTAHEGHAA